MNKNPYIEIPDSDGQCWEGWGNIAAELKEKLKLLNKKKIVITIESNLGTYLLPNLKAIKEALSPTVTCQANSIYKDEDNILELLKRKEEPYRFSITDTFEIQDFFEASRLEGLRNNIDFIEEGLILIHGIGASFIWEPDILIYSDISKWEQLQRFRRNEISNIGVDSRNLDYEIKEKWSFFTDWRICDKIKKKIIKKCHYFIETNNWKKPKMASGEIIRKGYELIYQRPFLNAPFFDPGLWEPAEDINFEWTYNCNMDKNNVLLKIGNSLFETPSINLILYNPSRLLGPSVYRRFGSEMPIRFNFIDTLDEKDYNIYTYPSGEILEKEYGVRQQHLSIYYVVENNTGATISIDLKKDTSIEFMEEASISATTKRDKSQVLGGLIPLPLKKHDHLVIPTNIMHTKGDRTMLLHISTGPSIFEERLFNEHVTDHSEHVGHFMKVTEQGVCDDPLKLMNTTTSEKNDSKTELLAEVSSDKFVIKRYWIEEELSIKTSNTIQVINVIEGESIEVSGNFYPFIASHSETFVIPASIQAYNIKPVKDKVCVLLATIKD